MAKTPFDDFVDRHVSESNDLRQLIGRDVEITQWQENLEVLYRTVENFLRRYLDSGKIVLAYQPTLIREELLGEYQVRSLEIAVGGARVRLEPIGTYLIGVKGRVDMVGPKGTVRLVLVDKRSTGPRVKIAVNPKRGISEPEEAANQSVEWSWKIAVDGPRIHYVELASDTFYSAMMEIVGG